MQKTDSFEKTPILGKIEGRKRREQQRMRWLDGVGWHQPLNGHEFEGTLGDGEGQESLACWSPWACEELDTSEQLNNKMYIHIYVSLSIYSFADYFPCICH